MITIDQLRPLHVLQDIPDNELTWLVEHGVEQQLKTGDFFVRDGEPSERMYIVLEGELEITRSVEGEVLVLGTTPTGIMGGERPLFQNDSIADFSCRAILPSRLLTFDKRAFRGIFAHCEAFSARIYKIAAERTQGRATFTMQREKMAALGKMAAGLAHELNNPAAANQRAVKTLRERLPNLQAATLQIKDVGLIENQLELLFAFQRGLSQMAASAPQYSPLEQGEREDEMADWLENIGVENAYEMAATFVSTGVELDGLQELMHVMGDRGAKAILAWLYESLLANGLFAEIEESSNRISQLVATVKEYTFMDRAPVQEVDIHHGLDVTVKMMTHKLRDITLVREFDLALPKVMGHGSELNQVWTNLIDNAADVLHENGSGIVDAKPQIRLITRCELDFVMVEITDNGPGIPANLLPRIFEPFFTTKDVGKGTGLGLDIVYRIIRQHSGTIEVHSEPGSTRVIVRLPANSG